jgi:hypothetical protein
VIALRWVNVGVWFAKDGSFNHSNPDSLFVSAKLDAILLLACNFAGLAVDTVLII